MTLLILALARTMNVLAQVDLMTIDSGTGKLVITDGFIIDQTLPPTLQSKCDQNSVKSSHQESCWRIFTVV